MLHVYYVAVLLDRKIYRYFSLLSTGYFWVCSCVRMLHVLSEPSTQTLNYGLRTSLNVL